MDSLQFVALWGVPRFRMFFSSNPVFNSYIRDVFHDWSPTPIPLDIIDARSNSRFST